MIRTLCLALLLLCAVPLEASDTVTVSTVEGLADAPAGRAVIKEAYRRAGIAVRFEPTAALESLERSNAGEVDAELQRIDGISATWPNLVQVPVPINLIQGVAFSSKYRFPVTGWHSLRPYHIGIARGIVFAEQNTAGMEVTAYDNYSLLAQALVAGEIDVAVMPRIEGLRVIRRLQLDQVVQMEGILETLFLYHYVHQSRGDLIEALAPILKTMLLNGETRQYRDRELSEMGESP